MKAGDKESESSRIDKTVQEMREFVEQTMGDSNDLDVDKEACPYCASPDLFQEVFAMDSTETIRASSIRVGPYWRVDPRYPLGINATQIENSYGKYRIRTITEKNLNEQYAGFTTYLLGVRAQHTWADRPGPFFHQTTSTPDGRPEDGRWRWILFFAFRMRHKKCDVLIDVHWWPSHNRIVTMRNIPNEGLQPNDVRSINSALKLLRKETRGGPKIEMVKVIGVIQKLGLGATQADVALKLKVSRYGFQKWLSKQEMSWDELKKYALEAQLI
jgi:hypothetical protein